MCTAINVGARIMQRRKTQDPPGVDASTKEVYWLSGTSMSTTRKQVLKYRYKSLLGAQQENKGSAHNNNTRTKQVCETLHTNCKSDLAIPRVRDLLQAFAVVA
jgi:hypothetical protein